MANYYDESVKIDGSILPKIIKEYIERLEEFDKEKSLDDYEMEIYNFDSMLKAVVLSGDLPESYYYKLMYKYGGEYDEYKNI